MRPALEVTSLDIRYRNGVHAVRGIDLAVADGRCLGIVGESGSGKSTIALAILGLLPSRASVSGSIRVGGAEIVGAGEDAMRRLRGRQLGLVAQDPMASFDPLMSVGHSVREAWRVHHLRARHGTIDAALEQLGIDQAHARARMRPHKWSGGMLQRAAIAAAEAHHPGLMVADEPTSALDADRAGSVLTALRSTGAAVLLVSHDLALVGEYCDEVAVMYAGRLVEAGTAEQVLHRPRHPYTRALLAATPRPGHGLPTPLPGAPPRLDAEPAGCAFAPRCVAVGTRCCQAEPVLVGGIACWEEES
jgi:peptide/nickel transport system ATP-binding protein